LGTLYQKGTVTKTYVIEVSQPKRHGLRKYPGREGQRDTAKEMSLQRIAYIHTTRENSVKPYQ